MMKKLGAICLLALAGTAQANEQLSTVEVYGLQVPGTPAIAKQAGFTDCRDNYSDYICTRTEPTVVAGLKAKSAYVYVNGSNNFSENSIPSTRKVTDFPPEKLSYSGVELKFDDRFALKKALIADGWLESSNGNRSEFFKEGVAASFTVYKSMISLKPVSLKEMTRQVSTLKAKQSGESQAESTSASFIDSMKK